MFLDRKLFRVSRVAVMGAEQTKMACGAARWLGISPKPGARVRLEGQNQRSAKTSSAAGPGKIGDPKQWPDHADEAARDSKESADPRSTQPCGASYRT